MESLGPSDLMKFSMVKDKVLNDSISISNSTLNLDTAMLNENQAIARIHKPSMLDMEDETQLKK